MNAVHVRVCHISSPPPPVNTGIAVAAASVLRVWCPHLVETTPKALTDLLKVQHVLYVAAHSAMRDILFKKSF